MGLRNHTIMERTLDDVFLSGTRSGSVSGSASGASSSGASGASPSGDRGNNSMAMMDKLPWIPLMKLDAQGWCLYVCSNSLFIPYPCSLL